MPRAIASGGNHYGPNGVDSKNKHRTKLAVSLSIRLPHSWSDQDLRECLDYRLRHHSDSPNPVVICGQAKQKNRDSNHYYVELRTSNDRDKLLELNNTKIEFRGKYFWLGVEHWHNQASSTSPLYPSDRYSNSGTRKHSQHHLQRNGSDKNWGKLNENSERNTNDNGDSRPLKRPRTSPPYDGSSNFPQSTRHHVSTSATNQSPKVMNDQEKLASASLLSSPPWKNEECIVYVSNFPDSMSLQDISTFAKEHLMKEAGPICSDVIVDCKLVAGKRRVCAFLCSSTAGVKGIIDELNNLVLHNATLRAWDNKSAQQQQGSATYGRTDNDREKSDTASTTTSIFVCLSLPSNCTIYLPKVISFLDKAIVDGYDGNSGVILGAEHCGSSLYRLKINSAENASKLVNLSGIAYNNTIKLILRKNEEVKSKHLSVLPEDRSVTIGKGTQAGAKDEVKANGTTTNFDSTHLKDENKKLNKQIFKLLKENKDMKRQNEVLSRQSLDMKTERIPVASVQNQKDSGSHHKPIELEHSSSDEHVEKKKSSKTYGNDQYAELKRNYESLSLELKNLTDKKNQTDKDLISAKSTCKELEKQVAEAKKEVIDDYERRLHEIHESWREQNGTIQEQSEIIENLKSEQPQKDAEKESLKSQLEDMKKRYQDMTDALTRLTVMLQEETTIRKEMTLSLVELRKGKKRAEKELKSHRSLRAIVKSEDKYDV